MALYRVTSPTVCCGLVIDHEAGRVVEAAPILRLRLGVTVEEARRVCRRWVARGATVVEVSRWEA